MPTVPKAIIFNTQSGFSREMLAVDFEREFRGKLGEKDLQVVSPEDALPLSFRKSHYRDGKEVFVRACWVRPPGFGDHDHVFDHEHKTLMQALKSDKSTRILLSLNGDLTHHSDLSFKNMKEDGAQNLENWIAQNRGRYVSVSINDASQAISTIKKASAEIGKQAMDLQVFALHRGAVVPYRNFYLGPRLADIANLYHNLQNRQSGVAIGETRMIGFPRLIRFMPTETTQREKGQQRP